MPSRKPHIAVRGLISRTISKGIRPAVERINILHNKLLTNSYPNCRQLASSLEVSEKTLLRDIEFMRDRLGLPVDYSRERHGYYYTRPVNGLPSLQITEGEAVALLLTQKTFTHYRGTPFEKPLQSAVEKLLVAMPDSVTLEWEEIASGFEIRLAPVSEADMQIFAQLSQAVQEHRVVEFVYHKLEASSPEARHVHPYQLCLADGQWYLVAHDTSKKAYRHFALPRISQLRLLSNSFTPMSTFDAKAYWKESFGAFRGTEKWEVRARFDPFASRLVTERQWHPSQKIVKLEGDEIELTLTLSSLHDVRRWLLGWGEHVTVLAPDALREQIRASAQILLQRHSPPDPAA